MTQIFTPPTAAFPDSAPDDPYFAGVKLLLHCDGADESTTFTDVAGHTVVANGNVQIDTAQSKFGGSSAYFDGVGSYLTLTTGSEFNLGTGDFTIEAWVRLASLGAWQAIFSKYVTWASNVDFQFEVSPEGLLYWSSGDSTPVYIVAARPLAVNTWYHVAVCRRSGLTALFVDGVLRATSSAAATIPNDKTTLYIGTYAVPGTHFNGWMDDIRFTAGTARYYGVPQPVAETLDLKYAMAHTWAAQNRVAYPITLTADLEDTAVRYPAYALQDGVKLFDLPRNGRIAGTLLNDGVPQPNTWVFLTYRLSNQVIAAKQTEADGTFEFLGLHPTSRYLVSAYQSRTSAPTANIVSADYVLPVIG